MWRMIFISTLVKKSKLWRREYTGHIRSGFLWPETLSDPAYRFQLSTGCFWFFMQTSFLLIPWCAWLVRLTYRFLQWKMPVSFGLLKCIYQLLPGFSCFHDLLWFFFFFCNYMSMLLFEINLQAFWEGFFMQTGSRSTKKDIFMHASMF